MRLANRTNEMDFFRRMMQRQESRRILLIEAGSGYGKTDLLAKFGLSCPEGWQVAQLDLKDATSGVFYLISRLQRKLGRDRFPQFERTVREFLTAGVEIANNRIAGNENTFQVILQGQDPTQQEVRLNRLYDAFFDDLAALPPSLLILDTFNAAPEQLQTWLGTRFLSEIAELDHAVVLAGQQVPKPTLEWRNCHHRFELTAIQEVDAWCEYAQGEGFRFSRDVLWTVVNIWEGNPAEIVKTLQTLERKQRP